jgi:hypothetical protein
MYTYIKLPSSIRGDSPTAAPQEKAESLCTIIVQIGTWGDGSIHTFEDLLTWRP